MNMEKLMEQVYGWGSEFGIKLIAALAILIIGRIVVNLIKKLLLKVLKKRNVDETVTGFVASLTASALWIFVIIAAMAKLGIETTSFMAIIGAAGLAIGLALQGSLSNFAAGFLLILFRPFKLGDFVNAGGVSGSIDKISIFTTDILTPDNKREIVPNSMIMNGVITNFTVEDKRRVDFTVGVGYDSDLKLVKEIINGIIAKHDKILKDPAPMVRLGKLNDSSLDVTVRVWSKTDDYWGVFFDFNEEVKEALDAANVNIPYPQMDVHLIK